MSAIVSHFLTDLLERFPVFLVYLVGMILAPALGRRCRSAGILVLVGAATLLLVSLGSSFANLYMSHSQHFQSEWKHGEIRALLSMLRLVTSSAYALGVALLLAAAFVGRNRRVGPDAAQQDAQLEPDSRGGLAPLGNADSRPSSFDVRP